MKTINKASILGLVLFTPRIYISERGNKFAETIVTTVNKYKNKQDNELKIDYEYHDVIFFKKHADTAEKYVKKGFLIYVDGRIAYNTYKTKNGDIKFKNQIITTELVVLGNSKEINEFYNQVQIDTSKSNVSIKKANSDDDMVEDKEDILFDNRILSIYDDN